jgi:DNA-binding PadR family transcriptional regulator
MNDSAILYDEGLCQLAIWLLLNCNHKDGFVFGINITKGQVLVGRNSLSNILKCKPSTIYKRLKKLESIGFIETNSSSKHTIVTVCNWDTYNGAVTEEEHQSSSAVTTKEHQSNTNKNEKNEKNERSKELKDKSLCSEQTICTEQDVRQYEPGTIESLQHVDITGTADEYIERVRGALNAMPATYWQDMQTDYPSVVVETEKRAAFNWLKENPSKRKKMVHKFFTGWMRRAALRQEKRSSSGVSSYGLKSTEEMMKNPAVQKFLNS